MRFRISTLMVVVLIMALTSGLAAQSIRRAEREAARQAEIARLRNEAAALSARLQEARARAIVRCLVD